VGGQYFGRRKTQLCTLPISNSLWGLWSVHNLDPTILPEGSAKLRSGGAWVAGGKGLPISWPLWSSGKKKAHDMGGPSSSLKESIYFLESSSRGRPSSIDFIYFLVIEKEAAKLPWAGVGARSATFGVLMSLKRRVRAAHGRARVAKTH
jgi:hypothetical protein